MTAAQKQRVEFLRAKGESYAAIADDLGISENTVKSYCRRNNIGIAIKQEQHSPTAACRLRGLVRERKYLHPRQQGRIADYHYEQPGTRRKPLHFGKRDLGAAQAYGRW